VRSATGLGARRAGEESCEMTRRRGVGIGGVVMERRREDGDMGSVVDGD
jgi:hypothetical protein